MSSELQREILAEYTTASKESIRRLKFSNLRDVDILALGCDSVLELVQLVTVNGSVQPLHLETILLGSRVTALDFVATTCMLSSDLESTVIYVEILVACTDRRLRLVSCQLSVAQTSAIQPVQDLRIDYLSASLAGKITDIACCRATGLQNRAVTVGDDGSCTVWNLHPEEDTEDSSAGIEPASYIIPHPYPLLSVAFHPEAAALMMTHDYRNTIRLINWTSDQASSAPQLSLTDPKHGTSISTRISTGSADWMANDGSVFGSLAKGSWVLWDIRQGDKPIARGKAFGSANGDGFVWSPNNTRQFAVFSSSPNASVPIKVVHTSFPQQPRSISFPGSSRTVQDVKWHPTADILCVALGNSMLLVPGAM